MKKALGIKKAGKVEESDSDVDSQDGGVKAGKDGKKQSNTIM